MSFTMIVFLVLVLSLVAWLLVGWKDNVDPSAWKGKVVVVLEGPLGKRIYHTTNLISNAGDVFYAQKGAGETPTNTFTNLYLGSKSSPTISKTSTYSSMTAIANTSKALTAGFPKTNDMDVDNGNGGVNIITYKYEYGKADFSAASITEGIIAKSGASGSDPVLCHFAFDSPFEKTANDTLTVYVNHSCEGVSS